MARKPFTPPKLTTLPKRHRKLYRWEFLRRQLGRLLILVSLGFMVVALPTVIDNWDEEGFSSPTLVVDANQAIPLWFSGFENGFPGEWLYWRNWNYLYRIFSRDGRATGYRQAHWTILDREQALKAKIKPIEGDHLYKGWIVDAETDGKSHRAYPILHLEDAQKDYTKQPPMPIVNRFYVWADWDTRQVGKTDWMHFLTLGNNPQWQVSTMSMVGPNSTLELAHVGKLNGFAEGNGWENLTDIPAIAMPLRQWVRFTVYVDYQKPLMVVWMDGQPIFRANGGTLRPTGKSTPYLLRAHWGMYAKATLNNGVQYNDSIQIWGLPKPLTRFTEEPISPYDGRGVMITN